MIEVSLKFESFFNRSRSGKREIEVLNLKKLNLIFQKQLHPGNNMYLFALLERRHFKSHTEYPIPFFLVL